MGEEREMELDELCCYVILRCRSIPLFVFFTISRCSAELQVVYFMR